MACSGDCRSCKNPCPASKFLDKINQQKAETNNNSNSTKECEKMSDIVKVAGCGAPSDPEQIRANAAIVALQKQVEGAGASTPLCFGLKTTTVLAVLMAAASLVLAIYLLALVGKYSAMIESAERSCSEALSLANKALASAENAEKRAEKNYIYLRGMKHDLSLK